MKEVTKKHLPAETMFDIIYASSGNHFACK